MAPGEIKQVDLKADRKAGALVVVTMHVEPGSPAGVGERLGDELSLTAFWLGLSDVVRLAKNTCRA